MSIVFLYITTDVVSVKSMRLSVRFDEETITPEHRVVCESPAIHRQLILGGHVYEGNEITVSYVAGDPAPFERLLASDGRFREYEITPGEDGFFLYGRQPLGASGLALLDAFHRETIVVVPPYEFLPDRTMRTTVVGTPADLQAVVEDVPAGMTVEVLRVGDHAGGPIAALTDRQREAVRIAWEVGFYDVPREHGIAAVADGLECAISTASAILRRAESRLVANALDVPRTAE